MISFVSPHKLLVSSRKRFPKLINNSKDKDKGNHAPWRVWISDGKQLVFTSLIFLFKITLFEKLDQTLVTGFHHNIKILEVRQKYSATRRIFNSLLGVWYVMKHCVSCLIYHVKLFVGFNYFRWFSEVLEKSRNPRCSKIVFHLWQRSNLRRWQSRNGKNNLLQIKKF